MKKLYIAVIALLVIGGGGVAAWKVTSDKTDASSAPTQSSTAQADTASAMQKQYEGYKGDDYDRMFLSGMMAHHQGAIDMAELARTNAKHQEVKDLATDIVSAQAVENSKMMEWQKAWGYPSTSGDNMEDHSSMMMQDEMAGMTNDLKGKTGDDFDKAFLTQMIMHHQQAIDMSKPAATNAAHQEVRDLAKSIIDAQTREISEMRSWQNQWGYGSSNTTKPSNDMEGMHM